MTIEEARRWFAEEVRTVAGLGSDTLVAAFARVPREAFLAPGPWQVLPPADPSAPYRTTPDADPRHLYHDVLIAIDPARKLNNGHPSSLARWIAAADVRRGDRVLHIGCGIGYYTAIFAETVGPTGQVVAVEVDPELAARARAALAAWPNVEVETGDASSPSGPFDVIFVNAGCTHPRSEWLAALAPGGRMMIPLTMHIPGMPHGFGAMFRVERGDALWPMRVVTTIGIFDCVNARDPANEAELRNLAALGPNLNLADVVAVIGPHDRGDRCVLHLTGFCLQK